MKKIGLVLSGGGAKGAYQVGMFQALEERGFAGDITAIAGTSIGAFDAAAYCVGGTALVRRILHEFAGACRPEVPAEEVETAMRDVAAGNVSLEEFVRVKRFRRCDTAGLSARLQELLPDIALKQLNRKITVCAYSLEYARPQYFVLNELPPQEQRDLILASGSLAYVFPPVAYGGGHYLDGGVIPPICRNGARPDKIPLSALRGEKVDRILVNFLNPADTVDHSWVGPGIDYAELRPSTPLEKEPGAGTLDFSPQKLAEHEMKGYQDTLALLDSSPAWAR